jgi:hypothetical protein
MLGARRAGRNYPVTSDVPCLAVTLLRPVYLVRCLCCIVSLSHFVYAFNIVNYRTGQGPHVCDTTAESRCLQEWPGGLVLVGLWVCQ